ncbi:MAG: WD40 domain-containing protein [Flavobacteriaceae bacterium]
MLAKLLSSAFEKIGQETGNPSASGRANYLEDVLRDDFKTPISAKSLVRYLKGQSNPSLEVLNALAEYLGHDNYSDYVALQKAEEQQETTASERAKQLASIIAKNPYKGLASFGVEDGAYFFGRSAELTSCLKKISTLHKHAFFSVVGDSGIGKSSFVQAGILYTLQKEKNLGFSNCTQIIVKPGSTPFTNLCYQLKLHGIDASELIGSDSRPVQLIVFLDQFEEVITQCHSSSSEAERKKLFNFLEALLANKNLASNILIISTFRSDFLSQMANFELVKHGESVFLSNLDYKLHSGNWENSMAEIVCAPANLHGVEVTHNLLSQLLQELKEVQGSLPILQLALSKIWNKESIKDGSLDAADYIRISGGKGISGMLENHAEKVVAKVTANGRDTESLAILKSIFVNLVEVHENGRDVKKTLPKEQLLNKIKFADPLKVEDVLEQLVNEKSRLITITEGSDKSIQVDIVHEVLIRKWERLRTWLEEDWEFLIWKKRLNAARDLWEYSGGDKDHLLKGKALLDAEEWLAHNEARIDTNELVFITESSRIVKKQAKRKRAVTYGFTALFLLIGLIMTGFYFKAVGEQEKAQANYLISEAKTMVANDPNLALRLAEAAIKIQPNDVALQKDANTLYGATSFYKTALRHEANVSLARFSPNGEIMLTVSDSSTARLWDSKGNSIGQAMRHSDLIYAASFSPDGSRVLTASLDGRAQIWDLKGKALGGPLRHSRGVQMAVFSPDGKRVLTASADGTARMWDAMGKQIGAPMYCRGTVNSAVFSPDGKRILTATSLGEAQVWDLEGNRLGQPMRHSLGINSAVFSPDGTLVLTASQDRTARLWDLDGTPVGSLMEHEDVVRTAKFSPNGRLVLTASWDRTARLWDLSGNAAGPPMKHDGIVWSANFSPDGEQVVTASRDKTARIWDLEGTPIGNSLRHGGIVWAAVFSPSGRQVLTASDDRTARLWDLKTMSMPLQMKHGSMVRTALFSKDGNRILSASQDHSARLWDLAGNLMGKPMQHTDAVNTAEFSPDERMIVTSSWDGTSKIWDVEGDSLRTTIRHGGIVRTAVFSSDGKNVLTSSSDGTARLWDLDGNPDSRTMVHDSSINATIFSPDNTLILTVSDDRTARLWTRKGEPVGSPIMHSSWVGAGAFSPDGKLFLTATFDGTVQVWDLEGKAVGKPIKHMAWARVAKFSPDGTMILTGSSDRTARLWDLNGLPKSDLMQHSDAVRDVAFSADGKRLLTCSSDGTARMWDLNGNVIGASMIHGSLVNSVEFSPDGTKILTASRDAKVRLWDLPMSLSDFLKSDQIKPLNVEQKEMYKID